MAAMIGRVESWYIVFTKPRKEELVSFYLQREKIPVFFPKIKEKTQRGRRVITVLNPLFPGYLFVRAELTTEIYNKIQWTRGVRRILGDGDGPTPIDNEVIEFLLEQTSKEGVIRPLVQFKEGDRMRIKYGPFRDLIGIIKDPIPKDGRIKVLMDIIKKSADIEVDESMLVAV